MHRSTAPKSGFSKTAIKTADSTAEVQNWIQDILTPSVFGEKLRYRQNVNGKGDCAKENDNISFVNENPPPLIHSRYNPATATDNADPELYPRLLMQKQGKDRNQNDIHRCDKSGLSHRRVLNTDLLQIAGYKQYHTAGNTSGQGGLSLRSPGSPALPARRQESFVLLPPALRKLRSPAAEKALPEAILSILISKRSHIFGPTP